MENWKQIKGLKNSFISDLGRYKLIKKNSEIITFGGNANGYLRVEVEYVHRLVAEYFCEKKEGCNIVNHLNGIKTDNRAINLEWTTYEGNNRHAFESGIRTTFGEGHWKSTSIENVHRIYTLKKEGKKVKDIMSLMPLTRKAIHDIFHGKNWRYEYEKEFGSKFKSPGIASGANCHNAIQESKVIEIYSMKKEGQTIAGISRKLALNYGTVKGIFNGKNWKHLYKQYFP